MNEVPGQSITPASGTIIAEPVNHGEASDAEIMAQLVGQNEAIKKGIPAVAPVAPVAPIPAPEAEQAAPVPDEEPVAPEVPLPEGEVADATFLTIKDKNGVDTVLSREATEKLVNSGLHAGDLKRLQGDFRQENETLMQSMTAERARSDKAFEMLKAFAESSKPVVDIYSQEWANTTPDQKKAVSDKFKKYKELSDGLVALQNETPAPPSQNLKIENPQEVLKHFQNFAFDDDEGFMHFADPVKVGAELTALEGFLTTHYGATDADMHAFIGMSKVHQKALLDLARIKGAFAGNAATPTNATPTQAINKNQSIVKKTGVGAKTTESFEQLVDIYINKHGLSRHEAMMKANGF